MQQAKKKEIVFLKHNEFEIAKLTFEDDFFVYSPSQYDKVEISKKYPLFHLFDLPEEKLVTKQIPEIFEEFIQATLRKDLILKAKIGTGDNLFKKLYKLSKLNLKNEDFYITDK